MKNHLTSYDRETRAANTLANQRLTGEDFRRWYECRHGHRFQAFHNKSLIVFKLQGDISEVADVLTCKILSVDLFSGFTSLWLNDKGEELVVGHTPRQVARGCFLHHLQESPVEYGDYLGSMEIKFPVVFKTLNSPNYPIRVEDSLYMLEDNVYDDRFGA